MVRFRRTTALAAALAVLALAPAAAEGSKEAAAATGPFKITMLMPSVNPEPIKPDNPGFLEIQKYTGYQLEVTWVPSTSYDEKVYAMMAAGDLPMVFVARQAKAPIIVSSARAGMFWEVGKYLKEFKELAGMNPDINRNVSIDGKLYGLYTERAMARTGLIFRKDWADKAGLGVPRTVDDMYTMARAFTTGDPDGNGQADTQGYSGAQDGESYTGFNGLREVVTWLGGPNNWGLVDGRFVPGHETREHLEGLRFFKRLFDEKLINQDFAVVKQSREGINANKSGMTIANYDQPYNFYGDVKKLVPTAVFDIAPRITGPKGERLPGTAGHNGFYALPKKSVKTEADLRRVLGFYDKLFDAPMQNLLAIGQEGRHYTVSGSNAVVTPAQAKLFADEINPLRQLKIDYFGRKALKPKQDPIREKGLFLYENNIEILVHDPTLPYVSDTMSRRGNELNKIIADADVKFVMGKIDEKGFKDAIDLWRKSGGDAAIKEYSEEQAKALANK